MAAMGVNRVNKAAAAVGTRHCPHLFSVSVALIWIESWKSMAHYSAVRCTISASVFMRRLVLLMQFELTDVWLRLLYVRSTGWLHRIDSFNKGTRTKW